MNRAWATLLEAGAGWTGPGAGLGALLGVVAGSFLATLAIRWPRGDSVLAGRSRCDGCGVVIAWPRLVPVASFVIQRGRCALCEAPIDPRHPAMELACALIGGLACGLQPGVAGLAGALFGWLLAALALLDRDHFWLPDRLVLPLGLAGLAAGAAGLPPPLVDRLIGAAGGYALLAALALGYRRARGRIGMGGGDPKLLAAIGAWLGWAPLPSVLLAASLMGLAWALLLALRGRAPAMDDRMPLGTLLAIAGWGGWLVMALTP